MFLPTKTTGGRWKVRQGKCCCFCDRREQWGADWSVTFWPQRSGTPVATRQSSPLPDYNLDVSFLKVSDDEKREVHIKVCKFKLHVNCRCNRIAPSNIYISAQMYMLNRFGRRRRKNINFWVLRWEGKTLQSVPNSCGNHFLSILQHAATNCYRLSARPLSFLGGFFPEK